MRKLAVLLAVMAASSGFAAPAVAGPPSVEEILDDLIVCVTEPCP